jgi:HAD superfamily hydrolase (TIGR01509 family)
LDQLVGNQQASAYPGPNRRRELVAVIFDVDGVIVDSPHERAWREALQGFSDPSRLTTALYQAHVAGEPRLAGASAVLKQLGVPDAARLSPLYAEQKQRRLLQLIEAGSFTAFPDALGFIQALRARGFRLAVASSSRNATEMMRRIRIEAMRPLLDLFDVDVCGRDVRRGKPDPELFLLTAAELRTGPKRCLVVEDAPVGIAAAKAGDMTSLGVARLGDAALLQAAGADLVVTTLDAVAVDALASGRLTVVRL